MNNLSSYCGLTDSRMSASDTDLPVDPMDRSFVSEDGHLKQIVSRWARH